MGVRKLKPTTPGQRHKIISDFAALQLRSPEKSLLKERLNLEVEITLGK